MNRQEAIDEANRCNAVPYPGGLPYTRMWFPKEVDGEWVVESVEVPGRQRYYG